MLIDVQDWSDDDLSLCLDESRGELDTAIARISDGHATKFGEVTKKKDKVPKRVEHGNGRGRGRGASTSAARGRSEFRGRGRGRGASTSTNGAGRNVPETTPSTNESIDPVSSSSEPLPAWAMDDAPDTADWTEDSNKLESTNAELEDSSAIPAVGSERPPIQTTSNGLAGTTASKPKSRIIDKNSTSSWASIAKPPAALKPPPPVQQAAIQTPLPGTSQIVSQGDLHKETAPLTEENLEAVTENQAYIPQPPTATVASLQGEPATGPSSLVGAPQTSSAAGGPPGLKSGQINSTINPSGSARTGTPVGGRRLNQNEAVVMPGSERDPNTRLGVQFGSLGLGDDEIYKERPHTGNTLPIQQQSQDRQPEPQATQENTIPASRQEKPMDGYSSHGSFGTHPQQQSSQTHQTQQQSQGELGGQGQEQYPGMSSFYGQAEPQRQSPFPGQADYYQQQAAQQPSHQQYGGTQSVASQRTENTSRPDQSRFGDSAHSPMTSMSSHVHHANTSPAPGHLANLGQHSPFPMQPQYGAPNPYAYYGYGYGYPQQQQQQPQQQHHSAYAPMYNQQRGGYGGGGGGNQYQAGPMSHQPVGTSQDRFERSTAEYQRQQQMSQYSQSGFGNTDFLGSSRNQQAPSEAMDPFKSYNSQGSVGSRDDSKAAPAGFGGPPSGFGQQMPSPGHYGEQQQQQHHHQQQQSQHQGQGQFSQYGSYGRAGGHQQYGGQQWNQY